MTLFHERGTWPQMNTILLALEIGKYSRVPFEGGKDRGIKMFHGAGVEEQSANRFLFKGAR
jgi:hypothetical protein